MKHEDKPSHAISGLRAGAHESQIRSVLLDFNGFKEEKKQS